MRAGAVIAALAAASTAHAHATFQYLWVDGVDQGNKCTRSPANNSPIESLTSNTLACNTNGEVAAAATCDIPAGTKVAVEMHQQPGDRNCATEAIGGNHDGPTIIYMAKVDNAGSAVGSEANWFKVAETGLVSKDYWGTDVMNANCGKVEFTIPEDIEAGNYLIRAEVIALHVAGSVGGAQLYMSCYQINVSGGGGASPATVKFPGAYSPTDPGILFNLYGDYSSYTIPGPAVYSAGGSSAGSPATTVATTTAAAATTTAAAPTSTAVAPTEVAPTSVATTEAAITTSASAEISFTTTLTADVSSASAPVEGTVITTYSSSRSATGSVAPIPITTTVGAPAVTTTTSVPSAAPTGTGVAAKYYQCGGRNWNGATSCASGLTCVVQNEWYHQCL